MISGAVLTNHEIAERLGLGPSDAQFLALLEFHGPLSPGELARFSGLTTGTVTGVIDRLERAGFVRRSRDTSDRRKVLVSRRENRIEHHIAPLYADTAKSLTHALNHYSPTELDLIAEFFERISAPAAESSPR